jgi:flagellar hook-basal body complex protein FliE
MNKFTSLLAGVSLLAIAGGASAEPIVLSSAQMDGVNAGQGGLGDPPPPTTPDISATLNQSINSLNSKLQETRVLATSTVQEASSKLEALANSFRP